MSEKRLRLAIIASHPIQYQVPFFRQLSQEPWLELDVLFCSDMGLTQYYDRDFGTDIAWDIPMVDGYSHRILRNVGFGHENGGFFRAINPGLLPLLLRKRYDACLIHGWYTMSYIMAIAICKTIGTKVILRGETSLDGQFVHGWRQWRRKLLRVLFKGTAAFLVIGKQNELFYRDNNVPAEKLIPVPYAVDNLWFREHDASVRPLRTEIRTSFGIPADAFVFLFCGKLIQIKRPDVLLDAFARLDIKSAHLVFAGDGELRESLEAFSHKHSLSRVHFLGFINQRELPKIYVMSDALVLPSSFEPWGLVVNEAMNFGIPALVSSVVGCMDDLIVRGKTGFVFEKEEDLLCGLNDIFSLAQRPETRTRVQERVSNYSYQSGIDAMKKALAPSSM